MANKIRAIKIYKVKLLEREGKRDNKIYIHSNWASIKHETWMC